MADNVAFTPGAGATGAADDIGGVYYPRVKTSLGADGSATDWLGGGGALASGAGRVVQVDSDTTSASVTSATTLVSLDTTGYAGVAVQVTSAGAGCTVIYEMSNDATNWLNAPIYEPNFTSYYDARSTTTVTGLFLWAKMARYFRARVSTYGSGTVSVVATMLVVAPLGRVISYNNGGVTEGNSLGSATPPTWLGFEVRTSSKSALSNGIGVRGIATQDGRHVQRPHAIPENTLQYAAAGSGIVNTTTAVTIFAAAGSGIRNYLTSLQIMSEVLGTATELAIRDGAGGTVLWRTKIGTGGITMGQPIDFPNPIRGTANTLMEVVTLSASVTGAVYVNAQGYTGP